MARKVVDGFFSAEELSGEAQVFMDGVEGHSRETSKDYYESQVISYMTAMYMGLYDVPCTI